MKTRRNKTTRNKTTKNKTKKVFGYDRIINFNIHKITLISLNPDKSAKALRKLFTDKDISKIIIPTDDNIKKRGTRWIRFKRDGKGEVHFAKPYHQKYFKCIKDIIEYKKTAPPLAISLIDNHGGIYVPNLSNVIIKTIKNKLKALYVKRGDGMHQWFVELPECLDFICFDSPKLNISKVENQYPKKWAELQKTNTFEKWSDIQKKYLLK